MKWKIGLVSIAVIVGCTQPQKKAPKEPQKPPEKDNTERIPEQINAGEKALKLDSLFNLLHRLQVLNGNVLIARRGVKIYENVFGYANFRKKDTLTVSSAFQPGSITKQFTAVGIMILKERGLLSYEDTVQQFFPDFPYHGITIRMLLTHRSGLPNYIYFLDEIWEDKQEPLTNREAIHLLSVHHPIFYYPPDKTFDYSNTGYMLLAAIIEEVSGMSYGRFMKKEIFRPLKMHNTRVYNKNKHTRIRHKATGYLYRLREAEDNYLNGITGDKGIYSTVGDLLKWDMGLYGDKIIKQSTLQEAFKPQGKPLDAIENYGFGWRMYYLPDCTKVLYHAGWWQGFQGKLIRVMKDTTTIIILKNKKKRTSVSHTELFKILYPDMVFPEPVDRVCLKEKSDTSDQL